MTKLLLGKGDLSEKENPHKKKDVQGKDKIKKKAMGRDRLLWESGCCKSGTSSLL